MLFHPSTVKENLHSTWYFFFKRENLDQEQKLKGGQGYPDYKRLRCRHIYNKNRTDALLFFAVSCQAWCCIACISSTSKSALLLSSIIINGCQFNFLSKQLPLITHRKKWLILMKPHRPLSYILPWKLTACLTCVTSAWSASIGSQLFLGAGWLSWYTQQPSRATSGFSREASGALYPASLQQDSCCSGLRWFVFLWKWTPFK